MNAKICPHGIKPKCACAICKRVWERERSRRRRAAQSPGEAAAERRKDYARNPTARIASSRKWVLANKERVRAYRRKTAGLPCATRPEPEFCEWPGCIRKASHLDHCHTTESFRGFLCRQHNTGLGMIGDTRESLQAGIDYLTRAEAEMWLHIPGDGLPPRKIA